MTLKTGPARGHFQGQISLSCEIQIQSWGTDYGTWVSWKLELVAPHRGMCSINPKLRNERHVNSEYEIILCYLLKVANWSHLFVQIAAYMIITLVGYLFYLSILSYYLARRCFTCMCACVPVCRVPSEARRGVRSPGNGITDSSGSWCRCWTSNSCALGEQNFLITVPPDLPCQSIFLHSQLFPTNVSLIISRKCLIIFVFRKLQKHPSSLKWW